MNKNLILLTLSQIFSFTAAPVTVFLSGIIGSQISPMKSLATLPMSISVVGIAIGAIVATKIMSLVGRKLGFIYASIGNALFSILAAYSIFNQNFYIFCFANFFIGIGMAFTHQYRFAAAESVAKNMAPKAVSILLFGGIISAFLGPSLANYSKDLASENLYVGSYLSLAVLTFIPTILFLFYESKMIVKENVNYTGRSYLELISQPRFIQAITASAFGYAVMNASISCVVGFALKICSVTLAKTFLASGSFSKTPCTLCFSPPPSSAIRTFCKVLSSNSGSFNLSLIICNNSVVGASRKNHGLSNDSFFMNLCMRS